MTTTKSSRESTGRHSERGAGMAEYTFLLALVAVALVAGFQGLATAIGTAVATGAAQF